jgi:hypothetical protein
MITNPEFLKKWEDNFLRTEKKMSYSQSLRLLNSMWREAADLEVFPRKEPLEGIEVDIKIAKVLNSCLKKSYLE